MHFKTSGIIQEKAGNSDFALEKFLLDTLILLDFLLFWDFPHNPLNKYIKFPSLAHFQNPLPTRTHISTENFTMKQFSNGVFLVVSTAVLQISW